MPLLIAAPVLLPLATAILCFLLRRRGIHRWVSVGSAGILTLVGVTLMVGVADGPVSAQMGGWAAPYGITLAADVLAAAMVTIAGLSGFVCLLYATTEIDEATEGLGFHALAQAVLGGVCGAFMTGDLFNLYVWFEVMLIGSFGLLVIGGGRAQIDGAVKYVALNLVGTLAFLTGVGLLYGTTGTLNMADLAVKLQGRLDETAVLGAAGLLIFAFSAKAALFPVFFWLPASYHTPAVATSALFSALLTKVGVYSLLRVFTLVFPAGDPVISPVILAAAAVTVAVGALGAAAQTGMRRIFSFHIVSQIGVMSLGLGLGTPFSIAAAVFYFFHHIPAMMNMFLIGGVISRECGGSERLDRIGGLWTAAPWLGVVFLVPALSLIGVPPLSGFWAKFFIIDAGVRADALLAAGLVLLASVLTFYYFGRLFVAGFWQPREGGAESVALPGGVLVPVAVLTAVTLLISLFAGQFYRIATIAAGGLADPTPYLRTVLGGGA